MMLQELKQKTQGLILQDYSRYRAVESLYKWFQDDSAPRTHYPTDINLELTSFCNAKCTFCTHEELVTKGLKKAVHMEQTIAVQTLERLRALTDELKVPDNEIRLSPVGLGEPTLVRYFSEVVREARRIFPHAHIHANTNGISLKGERAEKIIDCGLDRLIISLCFNDPVDYKNHMGVDRYTAVIENIENFLRLKGNRKPDTVIHIFDLPENKKRFSEFIRYWTPHLNANDFAGLYHYVPLTDWTPTTGDKYACSQLWNVLMVDAEGYVFPCCLGVWTRRNDDLCLGHISQPTHELITKLNLIRERHLKRDFRVCDGCGYLNNERARNRKFEERLRNEPKNLFIPLADTRT